MENLSPVIFLAFELRSFHHNLSFVWFCLFYRQSGIKATIIELPEEGQLYRDILFENQSTMFESYLYIPLNLFFASTCTMGRTQRWIIFNWWHVPRGSTGPRKTKRASLPTSRLSFSRYVCISLSPVAMFGRLDGLKMVSTVVCRLTTQFRSWSTIQDWHCGQGQPFRSGVNKSS